MKTLACLMLVALLAGCGEPSAPPQKPLAADAPAAPGATVTPAAMTTKYHPCLLQDGRRLGLKPIRAIGTEPFWGARTDGRCVIYSHPDDQKGTRVWAQYSVEGDRRRWTGALGGKPFVMVVRDQPGCSDGMSDEVYPMAVELEVGGEKRSGCAKPL